MIKILSMCLNHFWSCNFAVPRDFKGVPVSCFFTDLTIFQLMVKPLVLNSIWYETENIIKNLSLNGWRKKNQYKISYPGLLLVFWISSEDIYIYIYCTSPWSQIISLMCIWNMPNFFLPQVFQDGTSSYLRQNALELLKTYEE